MAADLQYTVGVNAAPAMAGIQAFKSSLGGLATAFAPLAALTGGLLAAGAAGAFMGRAISEAANMETMQTSFVTLLGSVDAAKARMDDLSKFAASTPFELPEIAAASRTLETLTKGALSTGEGLTLVGDVASSVGQPFSDMSTIIGRLYDGLQSGRAVGEAMYRLQELGVISGVTRGKIEQLQASGAKGDAVWQVAAGALANFSGSMERQSQTWNGLISTLQDGIAAIFREFGAPLMDALKPALQGLVEITDGLAPKAAEFGAALGTSIAVVVNAFKSGSLGELVGTGMKLGFANALNFLVAGLRGAVAMLLNGLSNLPKILGSALQAITNPSLWSGLQQVLKGIAGGFVSFLASVLAPVVDGLLNILRGLGVKVEFNADELASSIKDTAAENWKQGTAQMTGALDPLFASVSQSFGDGLAAFQEAFINAPELIKTDEMRDSLASLVNSLKPIQDVAKSATETAKPKDDETSVSSAAAVKAAQADNYAKIGLFVGGGAKMQSEQAKTNSLLSNVRDTLRTESRGVIEAIKNAGSGGLVYQ